MKLREDFWLRSRIERWVEQGIISNEQGRSIVEYEAADRYQVSGFMVLATLGGLSIALGLLLLVGYNWESIPPLLRQVI